MTTHTVDAEAVVLGLLPSSSHTHGPRVARPDGDSPADKAGGVRCHDTPCKPVPVRKVATSAAHGPTHTSVSASNPSSPRIGSQLPPVVTRVVSLLVATGLAATGVVVVDLVRSTVGASNAVGLVATGAAAICGLLLMTAALIDTWGDDR